MVQEKSIQEQANEYANICISSMEEMLDALDHACGCSGDIECTACEGAGYIVNTTGDHEDCEKCNGIGEIPCTAGKDSDCPENWHDEEAAHARLSEDPLSVEIRSDWHTPGSEGERGCGEFNILITMGGPAARIIGDLENGSPTRARFQWQHWFTPWTEANTTHEQNEIMLRYAQEFYYEE